MRGVGDLLIVGGGPAGLSTAIEYLENGGTGRVTILEALKRENKYDAKFPGGGHSQCSGGLSRRMMEMVGWDIPKSVLLSPIRRALIRGPTSRVEIDYSLASVDGGDLGVVMDRKRFDDWLVSRAVKLGVEYRTGFRARGIARHGAGYCAISDFENEKLESPDSHVEGDFLVGADGPESLVSQACFTGLEPIRDEDMFLASEVYIPRPSDLVFPHDAIELYFEPERLQGYYWTFAGGNVAKVGCGTTRATAKRAENPLNPSVETKWWCEKKNQETGRAEYLDGFAHPIERVGGRITAAKPLKTICDPRRSVALVGEAARAVWASVGAGDASAVLTGRRLGQALARNRPEDYQRWWVREHYKFLKTQWKFKQSILSLSNLQMDRAVNAVGEYRTRAGNLLQHTNRFLWWMILHEPRLLGKAAVSAIF